MKNENLIGLWQQAAEATAVNFLKKAWADSPTLLEVRASLVHLEQQKVDLSSIRLGQLFGAKPPPAPKQPAPAKKVRAKRRKNIDRDHAQRLVMMQLALAKKTTPELRTMLASKGLLLSTSQILQLLAAMEKQGLVRGAAGRPKIWSAQRGHGAG